VYNILFVTCVVPPVLPTFGWWGDNAPSSHGGAAHASTETFADYFNDDVYQLILIKETECKY